MFAAADSLALPKTAGLRGVVRRSAGLRNAVVALSILLLFVAAGAALHARLNVALPGPVIGLTLLAAALVLVDRLRRRMAERLHRVLAPLTRQLLAHMGLLFVPAGAGIVTEASALKHEGVALCAGLVCSVLVGVAVTYGSMRLLVRHADRVPGQGAPQ